MRYFALIGALLMGLILAPLAVAQQDVYPPKLGDIMTAIQLSHIKLWFAGKLGNWDLAAYEVAQIKESLGDAAQLYREIPVDFVTNTADPIDAIRAAADAKDGAKFAKAFGDLNQTCNACHQVIRRGFIVIQVPTGLPFTDQSFAPAPTP
jgi:hypothetical protein